MKTHHRRNREPGRAPHHSRQLPASPATTRDEKAALPYAAPGADSLDNRPILSSPIYPDHQHRLHIEPSSDAEFPPPAACHFRCIHRAASGPAPPSHTPLHTPAQAPAREFLPVHDKEAHEAHIPDTKLFFPYPRILANCVSSNKLKLPSNTYIFGTEVPCLD